jgi:hypothetical protein
MKAPLWESFLPAGIRGETADEVEAIGVERSRVAAAGADAVVMVVDASEGWRPEDEDIWRSVVVGGVENEEESAADSEAEAEAEEGEELGEDSLLYMEKEMEKGEEGEEGIHVGDGAGSDGGEGGDEWANAMARLKKVRGGMKKQSDQQSSGAGLGGGGGGGSGSRGPGGKTAILVGLHRLNPVDP